jgi:hypothetical protein
MFLKSLQTDSIDFTRIPLLSPFTATYSGICLSSMVPGGNFFLPESSIGNPAVGIKRGEPLGHELWFHQR